LSEGCSSDFGFLEFLFDLVESNGLSHCLHFKSLLDLGDFSLGFVLKEVNLEGDGLRGVFFFFHHHFVSWLFVN